MSNSIRFRQPIIDDGNQVFDLINKCPPLDTNSSYCNFLQCSHFASTSVAAVDNNKNMVGFISGYIVPEKPDALFIWQVAIDKSVRGQGLAHEMIQHVLDRPICGSIRFVETTISPDNRSSWRVFEKLAEKYKTQINESIFLDKDKHFDGEHDSEVLVKVGPFQS